MIIYDMSCDNAHRFEGWFRESNDCLQQLGNGLISCPVCGSHRVKKVLTASRIRTGASDRSIGREANTEERPSAAVSEYGRKLREYFEQNYADVGKQFPEEARKAYYGETEPRNLYGIAKTEEVIELLEEGIAVAPLPVFLRKPKKLN